MNIEPSLLRQARKHLPYIILTILFGITGGVTIIIQANQLSRIISGVFLDGWILADAIPYIKILLWIILFRSLTAAGQEITGHLASSRIKNDIHRSLVNHLFTLGPAYTQNERTGDLTVTFTEGIENLTSYFSQFIPQLILAFILPLVFLVVVFPLDKLSGLIFLLTIPLIPVFMILIGQNSEKSTRKQMKALNQLSAQLLDAMQGLATLKILGRSDSYVDVIEKAGERYRITTMQVLRLTFLSALALELLGTISTAIVAVSIGLRLLYGTMDYHIALFILIITPEVYLPLRTLGLRFHAAASGVTAAQRIFTILDKETTTVEPIMINLRSMQAEIELPAFTTIHLEDVSFCYPGMKEFTLRDVNFTIHAGEKIALIGSSGGGKSTLAGLLLRFYDPSEGQILVDGKSIRNIPPRRWRQAVTWVPQNPRLFAGSLAENLRLANPDASLSDLEAAASQAHLLDWIRSLPDGWSTMIGEQGARLSAGQAQRLSMARAYLKPAPLLIMDEPTSHLDPELEASLRDSATRLMSGRTVLTIAHRLATIYQADRILLIESGRVITQGSHQDLLANSPVYQRMVRSYAGDSIQNLPETEQESE